MSQMTSPFKFLDSYQQEDSDIFFGREKETNDLYHALSGVKHLLVYGPSGAGKTSLVECGLRNQFSDADWFALTIRRGADIAGSVFTEINKALREKMNLDPENRRPLDPETDFGQAIEQLFSERYQPVYLLFDQFEELLISGSDAEKKDFFARLNQLIRYKVPCRVMLIMREEFIGHLSEFEPLCPSIFQHRFRLEKMRKEHVKEVIHQTLDAPHYRPFFRVENSEQLAESILAKLPDKSREIELAHVQVFLSELWDRADRNKKDNALPLLQEGLIRKEDNLAGVLDSFLKKQLDELNAAYGDKTPLETLAAMISERHTKLQLSAEDLQKDLDAKEVKLKAPLPKLLRDLEQRRILRTVKSGEQTQYELSHDVLALVVGQNLTKEMQMRAKAADIYGVYNERKGFFSQEDLDYIRPYRQYKAYPPALEQRIRESEDYLHAEELRIRREKDEQLAAAQRQAEQERQLREKAESNEKRARQRTRLALGVSGLALVLAVMAGYLAYTSNEQQKALRQANIEIEQKRGEAQKALDDFLVAERRRKETEINTLVTKANQMLTFGQKPLAINNLELALRIDSTRQDVRKQLEDLKPGQ
jgi:DNA polymerase III delta prime subunit